MSPGGSGGTAGPGGRSAEIASATVGDSTVPPRRGRGRPKLPKPTRRLRAQSPFVPTRRELTALPTSAPLQQAFAVLPEVPTALVGELTVADLPIQVPGVRFAVTATQAAAAAGILRLLYDHDIRPYADNSRRSIRSDWRHWIAFCVARDKVAMPIAFEDLKEFFDALIEAGYRRASLEHLIWTLELASQIWSCPCPTTSPTTKTPWDWYWKQMGRDKLKRRQYQAPPLNTEDLDALVAVTTAADARALRDLAFAAVAYDGLARASELVAMRWADINFSADPRSGGALYLLPNSKTDQEGDGRQVHLTAETVRHLRAWQAHRFPENPYVFHALPHHVGQPLDRTRPLAVREVGRIFERLRRRTASDKLWSGHSARVGAAQDMTRAGMEQSQIMQIGRWKSPTMPARYSENELANRAGRGRAAALRKLKEHDRD